MNIARPSRSRSLLVQLLIDLPGDELRLFRQGIVGAALVAALGQPQGLPLQLCGGGKGCGMDRKSEEGVKRSDGGVVAALYERGGT